MQEEEIVREASVYVIASRACSTFHPITSWPSKFFMLNPYLTLLLPAYIAMEINEATLLLVRFVVYYRSNNFNLSPQQFNHGDYGSF